MPVTHISPIFERTCEYADLEYLSEAIYEELSNYIATKNTIDMDTLVAGEFEILVNWNARDNKTN